MKRWVVGLAFLFSACGSENGPSGVTNVAGTWVGTVTQTSAVGTECGDLFRLGNGATEGYTVSITQTGTAVSGTLSSQATGRNCQFFGSVVNQSVTFNRRLSACQPPPHFSATCNGASRALTPGPDSMTGTANGNTLTGTIGESWNVYDDETDTGDSLGIVAVSKTFTFTR